jgi:hypothetical protein
MYQRIISRKDAKLKLKKECIKYLGKSLITLNITYVYVYRWNRVENTLQFYAYLIVLSITINYLVNGRSSQDFPLFNC